MDFTPVMGNHWRNLGRKLTSYIFNIISKNGERMKPEER